MSLSRPAAVLGANRDDGGVDFALFSDHATAIELCLFEGAAGETETRLAMESDGSGVWRRHVPGLPDGQLFGYRVYGPDRPELGHRFNPDKLLLDPRARAITPMPAWNDALLSRDTDSAPHTSRCVVVDSRFDWAGDAPPRTPWDQTLLYECHVKGMTVRHPDVEPALRGTYLGLVAEPVLDHLRHLGVTAVELMPVHHAVTERHLAERGRTNYWGYSPIGFFAPDGRFATASRGEQVREFQTMVAAFHAVGIEVILDVVFNHTAEGDETGPTLCFRGIDNAAYYRLQTDRRRYADTTGCGNALDVAHPRVLELVLDSLRYWVEDMHVDGFRFDLAPSLARENGAFAPDGAFFRAVAADPDLAGVKLIAEPWDLGDGGYRLGEFPAGWTEWNGRYRDCARRFWRGDRGELADLAARIAGSSDLFAAARGPLASINFVTCHDGLTLRDLVSYGHPDKNADTMADDDAGGVDDFSHNWGHEGPTDDPAVAARRRATQRNLLASLAFSQGVPMLSAGDEIGRTQRGNQNAYCHDSELSWLDWQLDEERTALFAFTCLVFNLRRELPTWRRSTFFRGAATATGEPDVVWRRPDAGPMTELDWRDPERRALCMQIAGAEPSDGILLCINGAAEACRFTLPRAGAGAAWHELVRTVPGAPGGEAEGTVEVAAYALLVLRRGADA